jgi:acetate kinase
MIDNIGKQTSIDISRDEQKVLSRDVAAGDFTSAATIVLKGLSEVSRDELAKVDRVAVRVVHGGDRFTSAVPFNEHIRRVIEDRDELAPLHNANSLKIIDVIQQEHYSWPIMVAFDTAFHHTLPEKAWRYPIDRVVTEKYGIRKFGFHGLSHRYMLEEYAHLVGKDKAEVMLITMHLEGGSSITAIEKGRSVETSMGFTPLEGLMMATRSGSVDPAILPFLMKKGRLPSEEVLNILEKKSGLLGVSGVSLDTRILRKREDSDSKLALEMFGYRVRQMVGAYLAVLGKIDAIVFGGGIGENTPEVRKIVCDGLASWGLDLNERLNESAMSGDVCLSNDDSKAAIWAIHSDEAKQLAYECAQLSVH